MILKLLNCFDEMPEMRRAFVRLEISASFQRDKILRQSPASNDNTDNVISVAEI